VALALGCGRPAVAPEPCAGVPDDEATQGLSRYVVERAEPLTRERSQKELPGLVGARLYVRAAPALTAEWLSRVLACQIAKRAPGPALVEVDVTSAGSAFDVMITARDADAAREVLRRARALAAAAQSAR
jgi:hypothetical protein